MSCEGETGDVTPAGMSTEDALLPRGLLIPGRLTIGVTGHRNLDSESLLVERIGSVLRRIDALLPRLSHTPVEFTVLSPLAEGADRLVAREVLRRPGAQLEAVLPMGKEEYAADFALPESRREFEELLSRARARRRLRPAASRAEAYAQAGRYVVDRCDVLVALWDGNSGDKPGGTAEVVRYAREKGCPLFWINTASAGRITYEGGRGLNTRALRELDAYNAEKEDRQLVERKARGHCAAIRDKAVRASIWSESLAELCAEVLAHYSRADVLSLRYQHLHHNAGTLIYALATCAVAAAAFQGLFLPDWPRIAAVEIVLIAAVLAVVRLGRLRRWHDKWIDYRFLAERFRSALFLATAGVEIATLRPPRHLSLAYSPQDWMVSAFTSFWSRLPRSRPPGSGDFQGLKTFLLDAWIGGQIEYHRGTSCRHGRRHARLARAGDVLFGLTFAAACLHFLGLGRPVLEHLFLFLAIVLPAMAAALAAIRTQREYLRNARRSQEMAGHLAELKVRMEDSRDLISFIPLVVEAEEIMLYEHADWRVVVRFHTLEPPA